MVHIKVTKGLDIPIVGKPQGQVRPLFPKGEASPLIPHQIALDLTPFDDIKFRLLVKTDETVKLGQPLLEDKSSPGRFFVSPAGGVIKDIVRGLKRKLMKIIIDVADKEEIQLLPPLDVNVASREEILSQLKRGGIFAKIRQRPFNLLADPDKIPRCIFVKAIESAPFSPSAEMQVAGHEKEFQAGLNALQKLTTGAVNLVYREGTSARAFLDAKGVQKHTAEGPHPVGNYSVHIQFIDPILSAEDNIWTLNANDVVAIGTLLLEGRYFVERVVGIGGPGILEDQTGFFKIREGFPLSSLIEGRLMKGQVRLISGDVLTGKRVAQEDFLGFYDFIFSAVPENSQREFLHFVRLGTDKYTYTGTYLTGHLDNSSREYFFTTSQHGEKRAYIDGSIYDDVMPLRVPTLPFVRAVLAEDYDLAVELGLFEVDGEDFALPSFVDPSKSDMIDIVNKGLRRYVIENLK